MEQRMGADTDVRAVATALGLSLHHFHRIFVEATGETPAGYLRRVRLDAAALRLRWTEESVGSVALGLGYVSQPAFTRAFRRRFGCTPGQFRAQRANGVRTAVPLASLRRVRIRELDRLTVVAKRYVGDLYAVRQYWRDFAAALPPELASRGDGHFAGLLHDDPGLTPKGETRYDCCLVLGSRVGEVAVPAGCDLQILETRPGRYACLQHEGCWTTVAHSYSLVCDHWLARTRETVTDDPAIELHRIRRDLQPPDRLSFTVLIPIE